jgi:hypothetical protein
VIQVVEEFAAADRKGIKRLQGNCCSLRIQKNPDSVVVVDPNLVPSAFKAAIVTLPAYVCEALPECLDPEERMEFEPLIDPLEFKPDKKGIGAELKNGAEILGADLRFGEWRLVLSWTRKRAERLTACEIRELPSERGLVTFGAFDGPNLVAKASGRVECLRCAPSSIACTRFPTVWPSSAWGPLRPLPIPSALQIHHRRYRSHGGPHRLENLEPVCWDCHRLIHETERSR